jgi:glyoxylase-like metal-dependent hydrolase (beta-lactamase superfamily II)
MFAKDELVGLTGKRMRFLRSASAAMAMFALGASALAQPQFQPATPRPEFDTVQIKTTDLGNRLYMLEGEGGNIVVAATDEGVIMVDDQFAPLHDKIRAAVAKITDKPIRYLILTHFHRDHTGGDEAFAKDGATIVAQENVKLRLAQGTKNGLTGNVLEPAAASALPRQTFKDSMILKLGNRTAELRHLIAHTDGDTTVYFREANVLATGDIVTFGRYPNIDVPYGGNINRMIDDVDAVLAAANDDTKIVPGHGPLGNKAMIREYRRMLVDARDRVAKLIATGMTEDQAVAAKPNADYDAKLRLNAQQAGNFVRVVYRSLKP